MASGVARGPVLCDLGGTRIRFAVERQLGDIARKGSEDARVVVKTVLASEQANADRPFQHALAEYVKMVGDVRGSELRLSLPCEVDASADTFRFPNLSKAWTITRGAIEREFGFSRVRPFNDAIAGLYGVFELVANDAFGRFQHMKMVKHGQMAANGHMVLLGPGTGLGTTAGLRDQSQALVSDLISKPIPSEFGRRPSKWPDELNKVLQSLRTGQQQMHRRVLRQMSLKPEEFGAARFDDREYLVSGPGLVRIHEQLADSNVTSMQETAPYAQDIVLDAEAGSNVAVGAVKLFCEALGTTIADFMYEYDARVAVYLTGPLLNQIGWKGLARWGMIDAFKERKRHLGTDASPPIFLITHPYPELVGLSRFVDQQPQ